MFVEVVRLLIVFLLTAGGFAVGQGTGGDGTNGAIIGATLGACLGYVVGGVLGRLLGQAVDQAERRIEAEPAPRLFAGALGGLILGGLVTVVALPIALVAKHAAAWPVLALAVWIGVWEGFHLGRTKSEDLLALAGLSSRPLVRATPYGPREADLVLIDTSAVLDGRLLSLVRSGFLRDAILVPRFVLDEVQTIADAQDPNRRRRGRRGLEVLEAMQRIPDVDVEVLEDEVPEHEEVDAKLVALAKRLGARLLTVDQPLQKVAELQGIRCLSLQRLTDLTKPVLVPGEMVHVAITKAGREPGQGVGYLEDGTMVVVTDAQPLIGQPVDARVTSNVQTSMGRMIFASLVDAAA